MEIPANSLWFIAVIDYMDYGVLIIVIIEIIDSLLFFMISPFDNDHCEITEILIMGILLISLRLKYGVCISYLSI